MRPDSEWKGRARRRVRVALPIALGASGLGCTPTLQIAGVYFPAWLVSAVIGIALSYATVRGLSEVEATRELGGRVTREAALPGMSEYIRVRDYREQQILDCLAAGHTIIGDMVPVIEKHPDLLGIAIDEGTALQGGWSWPPPEPRLV